MITISSVTAAIRLLMSAPTRTFSSSAAVLTSRMQAHEVDAPSASTTAAPAATHGITPTWLSSAGMPAAWNTPKMTISASQASATAAVPSSSPCHKPASRHHHTTLSSAGSASPMVDPTAVGMLSARDLTTDLTLLDLVEYDGEHVRVARQRDQEPPVHGRVGVLLRVEHPDHDIGHAD